MAHTRRRGGGASSPVSATVLGIEGGTEVSPGVGSVAAPARKKKRGSKAKSLAKAAEEAKAKAEDELLESARAEASGAAPPEQRPESQGEFPLGSMAEVACGEGPEPTIWAPASIIGVLRENGERGLACVDAYEVEVLGVEHAGICEMDPASVRPVRFRGWPAAWAEVRPGARFRCWCAGEGEFFWAKVTGTDDARRIARVIYDAFPSECFKVPATYLVVVEVSRICEDGEASAYVQHLEKSWRASIARESQRGAEDAAASPPGCSEGGERPPGMSRREWHPTKEMRQDAKGVSVGRGAAERHVLHVGSELEWIHEDGVPLYYTHGMNIEEMQSAAAAELARISGGT